ncbi:MAG: 30S ribosomal protein S1 [Clostridia bacterium]|nr:30S ribosomal protein S1 [Clostridia bacterium]
MTDLFMPEGYYIGTRANAEYLSGIEGLERAKESGEVLEARVVMCDSNHNLIVDLGEYRGIIPREEALMTLPGESVREIAVITRVGKPVCFKVTEIEKTDGKPKIILSRRSAQQECYDKYIKNLCAGDIIDARITHQEPFGCFCDIGRGIISLLSIDCISVSRISHPGERFYTGQYIRAAVKKSVRHDGRISLTHKELLGTWEENVAGFNQGETVTGIVRSVEPYGIFIELAPNLAGLAEWRDGILPGQCAAVFIKNIIPEKMKIKLVTVDSCQCENVCGKTEYFINQDHIDYWKYSPECCERVVETVFDDSE